MHDQKVTAMRNRNPGEPTALQTAQNRLDLAKRILWIVGTAVALYFFETQGHVRQKFVERRFTQRNSVRLFALTFFVFVLIGTYLVCKTDPEHEDRAAQMFNEFPVAAYSMTAAALLMLLSSFQICTGLVGALGVVMFVAIWGFVLNLVFLSAIF
jgi:hypothetical protein